MGKESRAKKARRALNLIARTQELHPDSDASNRLLREHAARFGEKVHQRAFAVWRSKHTRHVAQ